MLALVNLAGSASLVDPGFAPHSRVRPKSVDPAFNLVGRIPALVETAPVVSPTPNPMLVGGHASPPTPKGSEVFRPNPTANAQSPWCGRRPIEIAWYGHSEVNQGGGGQIGRKSGVGILLGAGRELAPSEPNMARQPICEIRVPSSRSEPLCSRFGANARPIGRVRGISESVGSEDENGTARTLAYLISCRQKRGCASASRSRRWDTLRYPVSIAKQRKADGAIQSQCIRPSCSSKCDINTRAQYNVANAIFLAGARCHVLSHVLLRIHTTIL